MDAHSVRPLRARPLPPTQSAPSTLLARFTRSLPFSCLCCFGLLALPFRLEAQSSTVDVHLAWDKNPETNVVGYTLYYGLSSRNYTRALPAGTNTMVWARGLEGGFTYYFAVTAYANTGVESDFSAEVSFVAPGPPPNRPPTLDPIPDVTLATNSGPYPISLTGIGTGAEEENQVLRFTATSSNPSLLPDPIVLYTPPYDSGTLILSPQPNASGRATVTLTVNDGATRSNTVQRVFSVRVGTPVYQRLYVEAESGLLASPMMFLVDDDTGGTYISTGQSENGTARYEFNVDQSDEYVMWCRVRSVDAGSDSFHVSVDGGAEDVFDTGLALFSPAWQWVKLNGRTLGNPRRLTLAKGTHTVTFRGRETFTGLDAFYLTNDPLFVPVKLSLTRIPGTPPGMKISFQSPAGYRYDVQSSEDLKTWTTLWRSSVASANQQFDYSDFTPSASGKRFYRLLVP